MTVEGFHAADRFGRFDEAIERRQIVLALFDNANQRLGQEVRQMRGDSHWT